MQNCTIIGCIFRTVMRFLTGLLSLVALVTAGSVQDRGIDQAALAFEGEVDVLFDNFKTDYGESAQSYRQKELIYLK